MEIDVSNIQHQLENVSNKGLAKKKFRLSLAFQLF